MCVRNRLSASPLAQNKFTHFIKNGIMDIGSRYYYDHAKNCLQLLMRFCVWYVEHFDLGIGVSYKAIVWTKGHDSVVLTITIFDQHLIIQIVSNLFYMSVFNQSEGIRNAKLVHSNTHPLKPSTIHSHQMVRHIAAM